MMTDVAWDAVVATAAAVEAAGEMNVAVDGWIVLRKSAAHLGRRNRPHWRNEVVARYWRIALPSRDEAESGAEAGTR